LQSALHYGYLQEALLLKSKALVRAQRWEAAIQVLEGAVNEHGRTEALLSALQQAQQALKVSKQKDYYKILGVSRDADERTMKRAYRKLALLCASSPPCRVLWRRRVLRVARGMVECAARCRCEPRAAADACAALRRHHPDKANGEEAKSAAEKRFADISEAYEVLTNPEKRALHDAGEDPNDPNAGQGHGFGGFGGFGHSGFQQGGHTFHFQQGW